MDRAQVTQLIRTRKQQLGKTWTDIAASVGRSEIWTTAACLGQAPFSSEEALRLQNVLDLPDEAIPILMEVPYRAQALETVPRDPTVYRLYEAVQVYGEAIKTLIHEKFGDGIMSAIDFTVEMTRQPDPHGDRVVLVFNGQFLPYRKWYGKGDTGTSLPTAEPGVLPSFWSPGVVGMCLA
jgi:cyanate hydratase